MPGPPADWAGDWVGEWASLVGEWASLVGGPGKVKRRWPGARGSGVGSRPAGSGRSAPNRLENVPLLQDLPGDRLSTVDLGLWGP